MEPLPLAAGGSFRVVAWRPRLAPRAKAASRRTLSQLSLSLTPTLILCVCASLSSSVAAVLRVPFRSASVRTPIIGISALVSPRRTAHNLGAFRGGGGGNSPNMSGEDNVAAAGAAEAEGGSPQGLNGMDLIIDGWFHERGELWPGQAMSLKVKKVIDHHRSDFQDVLVFESTDHGKVLVLDGVIQVTERDEFAYQEMIAHIPLYAHPDPKRVLVIGGGDGGVLREIAKHSGVEEIVICEIDGDVIDVSKKHLPGLAKGYDDPRVKVHVMDGAKFMDANKDSFDVIITDSSDPIGPASVLFETPFYKAMHASLREGGIVCTQGECMWLHVDLIKPLIGAISKIYTDVGYAYTTIPTYPSGQIGFIVATKGRGACSEPARKPNDELQKTLRYYTPQMHKASFVLPAFARRAIFGE